MATHSSILAWKIPWTEKPGGLVQGGHTYSDPTEQTHTYTPIFTEDPNRQYYKFVHVMKSLR